MDNSYLELVQLVKDGQEEAMGELARRYGPSMLQFANQLLGGPLRVRLDAEDVVQSVLITIWLGFRTDKFAVPTPECLTALAKTLVRRQVALHWQKAKSEMNAIQEAAMIETVVDQQLIPTTPAEAGPQEKAEFEDLMENFLSGLTETDRQLVILRFHGFTTADAAVSMQIEPGHLRVRLARLREKFAEFQRDLMGHV